MLVSCNEDEGSGASLEEILEETAFAENVFADVDAEVDDAIGSFLLAGGRFGFGFENSSHTGFIPISP